MGPVIDARRRLGLGELPNESSVPKLPTLLPSSSTSIIRPTPPPTRALAPKSENGSGLCRPGKDALRVVPVPVPVMRLLAASLARSSAASSSSLSPEKKSRTDLGLPPLALAPVALALVALVPEALAARSFRRGGTGGAADDPPRALALALAAVDEDVDEDASMNGGRPKTLCAAAAASLARKELLPVPVPVDEEADRKMNGSSSSSWPHRASNGEGEGEGERAGRVPDPLALAGVLVLAAGRLAASHGNVGTAAEPDAEDATPPVPLAAELELEPVAVSLVMVLEAPRRDLRPWSTSSRRLPNRAASRSAGGPDARAAGADAEAVVDEDDEAVGEANDAKEGKG